MSIGISRIPDGLHYWDLIQPFFMFVVGAVMPVSFTRRWSAGEPWRRSLAHVLRRCALLILFGLIARSCQARRPVLDLINVLAQIAFTYLIAFLILRKHWSVQAGVAFALLALHWALYRFGHAPGVLGPWIKDANMGWYLDGLLLHKHWSGSYATINCVSSAANTIFGVMAGQLLIGAMRPARKLQILTVTGLCALLLGIAMGSVIPLNKKIWTASFAIYSTGFTLLAVALLYWIFDIKQKRAWGKLFVIVGSNSIFIYLFHEIFHRYLLSGAMFLLTGPITWQPALGRMLAVWVVIALRVTGVLDAVSTAAVLEDLAARAVSSPNRLP